MTTKAAIRHATPHDANAVTAIYNYYVLNSIATFDEEEISSDVMLKKIKAATPTHPFFIAEVDGEIIGYAYAGVWNSRSAYRYSCETSIYLSHQHSGKGLGKQLYAHLFNYLEENTEFIRFVAGISLPNPASEKLHASFGFKPAGVHERIGYKFNQWIDVGYFVRSLD